MTYYGPNDGDGDVSFLLTCGCQLDGTHPDAIFALPCCEHHADRLVRLAIDTGTHKPVIIYRDHYRPSRTNGRMVSARLLVALAAVLVAAAVILDEPAMLIVGAIIALLAIAAGT